MAAPLKIKAPPTAPLSQQFVVGVVFIIPVFYLVYLWRRHKELHFDNPRLNLAAHALMFILPAVWAMGMMAREIQFVESPGEFLGFSSLRRSWWKPVLLYQSLLLGMVFTARAAWQIIRGAVAPPSTSAADAMGTMVLVFLFTFMVVQSKKTKLWMLEDGLRLGLARFVSWNDIDHVGWHGRVVEIFHRENRHVPTASACIRDDAALNSLKQRLAQHGVRESAEPSPKLFVTIVTMIALAVVIFGCGLAAHYERGVGGGWVVLSALIVGGFASWLFEKTYIPASTRVGRPIIVKQPD